MIKRKEYPKEFQIGSEMYKLKFVRKLPKDTVGECCPEAKEIRVLCGLGMDETLLTVLHEIQHAIEFEYDIKYPHNLIHKLEKPIANFIRDNVFRKR